MTKDELLAIGNDLKSLTGDAKQAAIDAITAIIQARSSEGGGGGQLSSEMEIDPDLNTPQGKPMSGMDLDDVEFNDPDNLLKKRPKTDDDEEYDDEDGTNNGQDGSESDDEGESEDDANDSSSDNSKSKSKGGKSGKQQSSNSESSVADNDNFDDVHTADEHSNASTSKNKKSTDSDSGTKDSKDTDWNLDTSAGDDEGEYEDEAGSKGASDKKQTNKSSKKADPNNFSDDDDNEDDDEEYEDANEENPLDQHSKRSSSGSQTSRHFDPDDRDTVQKNRITRTVKLAKKAAMKAEATDKDDLKQKLLDMANELSSMSKEDIHSTSDKAIADKLNKVLQEIDKVFDITYTGDPDARAKKIQADFANPATAKEIDREDKVEIAKSNAKHPPIYANEGELKKYAGFGTMEDFRLNLTRVVKQQAMTYADTTSESRSRINRRFADTDLIMPGEYMDTKLMKDKIPVIDIYFDQSPSWSAEMVDSGIAAIKAIRPLADKKLIKLNIFYFANGVYTDAASARAEYGTQAWNKILNNIEATKATNVVLMTDTDMSAQAGSGRKVVVPGHVWFLWPGTPRGVHSSQQIVDHLVGKKGSAQYAFKAK